MLFFLVSIGLAADVKMNWKQDVPLMLGAGAGYFYLGTLSPRIIGREADPIFIDDWSHPQWNPEYSNFSDFMGHPLSNYGLNAPVLTTLGLGLAMSLTDNWQSGMMHSAIVMESVLINSLVTESIKLAVARPRPFTSQEFQNTYPDGYNGDVLQHEFESEDAFKSFPSGHTSSAAATYFSTATLLANSTDNRSLQIASYTTAALLTSLTGFARVKYGMHHPSDVITGGLIGAGIGFSTAFFHLER